MNNHAFTPADAFKLCIALSNIQVDLTETGEEDLRNHYVTVMGSNGTGLYVRTLRELSRLQTNLGQ